ncbi:MAG: chemotaxis protein CheD [Thermodesulfobacteriota bacterium]|nr:chemotaxis protein CheD [Thermodesulfobacteriota bacterium]
MTLLSSQQQEIYLKPGELVIAEVPVEVSTVLGSCVSVTLFIPQLKIGAICHAVLPRGDSDEPAKYVDQSVHYMLNHLKRFNVRPAEIVAKLFGGANMFSQNCSDGSDCTVGAKNIREATQCLRHAGLGLAASDTGGEQGRKLIFYTHTGEVMLKRVRNGR